MRDLYGAYARGEKRHEVRCKGVTSEGRIVGPNSAHFVAIAVNDSLCFGVIGGVRSA